MQESNLEHKAILAAIAAGDGDAARTAAEDHHLKGKMRWLNTLGR
jgi:DNA-binding FadR family transcriptional regulator